MTNTKKVLAGPNFFDKEVNKMVVEYATNLKEFNEIQMDWVLAEVKAIRNYMDSIEAEAKQGMSGGSISTHYMYEKTSKAKDAIEQIENRVDNFNHPS